MNFKRLALSVRPADLVRLGASLVLAVILWGAVTASHNPETTRTYANIPVSAGPFSTGSLQVVTEVPPVSVKLSGPRSVIIGVSASDLSATLDMDDIDKSGSYTVPIQVTAPSGVWTKSANPTKVAIVVADIVAKEFPISTVLSGPEVDPTRQVGTMTPSVSQVTVTGPSSAVDRVSQVVVPVTVDQQTRDFVGVFTPIAEDANGQAISEVTISPGSIQVTVDITARGKRIAVITQLVGDPAQGYEVVDRTINPSTVLVDGPDETLNSLISVSTEPIDISGATTTIQKTVKLVGLPDGVSFLDPSDGDVDVVVQIRQQGVTQQIPSQQVGLVNIAPGLIANVSPSTVTVSVIASEATIAKLTAGDIVVQLNLEGLGPGVYTLRPVVAVPSNVTWISTDPETVTVTISGESTGGTPVGSPRASPVASPIATPAAIPEPGATP